MIAASVLVTRKIQPGQRGLDLTTCADCGADRIDTNDLRNRFIWI